MTKEEELEQRRAENQICYEAFQQKKEELEHSLRANQTLREGLKQAIVGLEHQQEQIKTLEGLVESLQERTHTLEGQQAKDGHNSSLPPSSDRFVRPPKSLRQKSGKKPGGQPGHRGHHLKHVEIPDTVLIHPVTSCQWCHQDLRAQPADVPERRQVMDLPIKRLWVTEHRVEEKQCPQCFHLTRASFLQEFWPQLNMGPESRCWPPIWSKAKPSPTLGPVNWYRNSWGSNSQLPALPIL